VDPVRRVNPYIAGSPVTGTEMFFGREDVFSFVRRNLTGRHRDTPIVLYGQRRTGKTSVLYQMHRHLDLLYRCIFIDLHGLNLNGIENLLWGIANSIKRGLQRSHQLSVAVPDWATFSADPHAAFEGIFLEAVWSVLGEDHLVLMIDEVVRLHEEVQAERLEPEVFNYLRHLMQHFERLNFVFSLGSGVEEMKKDYAFLFGVALYHRISFLEPTAAHALITRPAQGCYQVLPDAADKIVQITSGHPYYTQLVCHCLFDRWLRTPKTQMTSADVDTVLTEAIELGSANLTYVWEDSTPEEKAMMAAMAAAMPAKGDLATVDQIREVWRKLGVSFPVGEAANAARNLTAREVVIASDGDYSFTVDLQRLWLDKHRRLDWVKAELGETAQKWVQPAPGTTRHGRRRLWFAAALIVAIVGIATGFMFTVRSGFPPAKYVALSQLRVGDCLLTPSAYINSTSSRKNFWTNPKIPVPDHMSVVSCQQSHSAEVYFTGNVWPTGEAYPGDKTVTNQSKISCKSAFQKYVGIIYYNSYLNSIRVGPNQVSWTNGDRRLMCIAYEPDGNLLQRSIKNLRQ
jgi:Septum formation